MEDEEEVANCEPSKYHVDGLVGELDEEHNLTKETVVAPVDLVEVCDGVDGREEAAVQPSPPLHDEFRHLVWHICFPGRGFHILQDPAAVAFRDQLEAEDTIFGKIHVCSEDACISTMHFLASKVLLQRSLAGLVILKCDISVGGEGSRKHGNKAECRFQRLIENVAHLVFKVLRCHQRIDELLTRAQHDLDLAASTSAHGLKVKSLPEVVDGVLAWLSPCI